MPVMTLMMEKDTPKFCGKLGLAGEQDERRGACLEEAQVASAIEVGQLGEVGDEKRLT